MNGVSQRRAHTTRERKTIKLKWSSAADANAEAARIILSDVEGFGGEDSGLCRWARLVIERLSNHECQALQLLQEEASR